jgi:PleD family two-component response regulator
LEPSGLDTPVQSPLKIYRLAKIEHYLRCAEDLFQMARYSAARKTLAQVLTLDADNVAAKSLDKRIAYKFGLLQRKNGVTHNEASIEREAGKRRKAIVLVVDQDERILERFAERLGRFGLEVVSASGYTEALETLGVVVPDLVISEVNFENGPAGFDLFLWLKSGATTQRIPFIYLATRIDRDVLIAGKRLGVDDFLTKPVDDEVVAASVVNALTRSRKRM